jgi:hypothetical protein
MMRAMRRCSAFVLFSLVSAVGLVTSCGPPKGADDLAAVIIKRPAAVAEITSPLRVTGTADVFEATFRLQLVTNAGAVLADRQVMATCGTGCRGTFDVTLAFKIAPGSGWVWLKAYELSSADGHRIDLASVPLQT